MKRTTNDPYATLGVKKTASTDEIKRARRKKAAKSHPDRGGDETEMAEINAAADILLDPGRRLLYDQTGCEQTQGADQQVAGLIAEAFMDALIKDAPLVLNHARRVLKDRRAEVVKQKAAAADAKKKMLARRGKITARSGENLFHALIDQQLMQAEGAIKMSDERIGVLDAALKTLDGYESSEEGPAAATARIMMLGYASTGGT